VTVHRFGDHRKPLSDNEISRRVGYAHKLVALADKPDCLPKWCVGDSMWVALLVERVGDLAAAHNRAHLDFDSELEDLVATGFAMLLQRERGRAA
jgi:hypothetical protein